MFLSYNVLPNSIVCKCIDQIAGSLLRLIFVQYIPASWNICVSISLWHAGVLDNLKCAFLCKSNPFLIIVQIIKLAGKFPNPDSKIPTFFRIKDINEFILVKGRSVVSQVMSSPYLIDNFEAAVSD